MYLYPLRVSRSTTRRSFLNWVDWKIFLVIRQRYFFLVFLVTLRSKSLKFNATPLNGQITLCLVNRAYQANSERWKFTRVPSKDDSVWRWHKYFVYVETRNIDQGFLLSLNTSVDLRFTWTDWLMAVLVFRLTTYLLICCKINGQNRIGWIPWCFIDIVIFNGTTATSIL